MLREDFYPTPPGLITRMISKIEGHPARVLEPSAGKGDIIKKLVDHYDQCFSLENVFAIEIDEDLQATLRGKGIKLIDTDFLAFAGPDKFDLIIGNPPFDEGDKHLLKAIEIMYRGQIIFLLNAETIRNPYTNTRKELLNKLNALSAEIEYIQNAFKTAERPTEVEIALVYINIERNVEEDLFKGCDDTVEEAKVGIEQNFEVSTGRTVEELVAEYNQIIQIGSETIIGYYRNYRKIGRYIGLNKEADRDHSSADMTSKMQSQVNEMLVAVRTTFWRRTLDLKEVSSRLTAKKRDEFEHQITERCHMDFTENNIRQFVLNLMGGFEKTLTEAVLEIFDKFTVRHCYSDGLYDDNIHYFNGWKTNKAFRVNKRIVIPIYGSYGSAFRDWGRWRLNWNTAGQLNDIDIVMNYFDGRQHYLSISHALEAAFERGESSKIRSTYFTITAYKKGTLLLAFNDENILRRFNVAACKGKGWLPHDYGTKTYRDMDPEERAVVNEFEGEKSYAENLGKPLFAEAPQSLLRIAA